MNPAHHLVNTDLMPGASPNAPASAKPAAKKPKPAAKKPKPAAKKRAKKPAAE